MNEKKLNIGFGECPMDGYVNIDDGSDFKNMLEEAKQLVEDDFREETELLIMDGNDMTFEDNTFDEVFSNQCVGIYVTNYDEIVRVLKIGGKIQLGVWNSKVTHVISNLLIRDVDITGVEWMNGDDRNIDNDDANYTLLITGVKSKPLA